MHQYLTLKAYLGKNRIQGLNFPLRLMLVNYIEASV